MSSSRRLVSSGGPYEARYGYSRAVAVGDSCWVAGTTDAGPDGTSLHPGDAAAQARGAYGIAIAALEEAGSPPPTSFAPGCTSSGQTTRPRSPA